MLYWMATFGQLSLLLLQRGGWRAFPVPDNGFVPNRLVNRGSRTGSLAKLKFRSEGSR
jgi:hypothetical protein